jgi:hypothetical protein
MKIIGTNILIYIKALFIFFAIFLTYSFTNQKNHHNCTENKQWLAQSVQKIKRNTTKIENTLIVT